jgi:hypothetical protein
MSGLPTPVNYEAARGFTPSSRIETRKGQNEADQARHARDDNNKGRTLAHPAGKIWHVEVISPFSCDPRARCGVPQDAILKNEVDVTRAADLQVHLEMNFHRLQCNEQGGRVQ